MIMIRVRRDYTTRYYYGGDGGGQSATRVVVVGADPTAFLGNAARPVIVSRGAFALFRPPSLLANGLQNNIITLYRHNNRPFANLRDRSQKKKTHFPDALCRAAQTTATMILLSRVRVRLNLIPIILYRIVCVGSAAE